MSALPTLQPPDAALLTRYLLSHENLHSLLSQPDAPALLPLLEFLARPDITPWLDHYRALQAHARQHAALNALTEVLRSTPDLTQRRLAATALLHHRSPRPTHSDRPTSSPLDASVPSRLHAFPSIIPPAPDADTTLQSPTIASAAPPPDPAVIGTHLPMSLDQSLAALGMNLDLDDPDENADDDALDRQLDPELGPELGPELDIDDQLDREADDPLLAAALTGDPAAINRLYLERTGEPPHPTLAAALTRALQPTPGPSG